MGEMGEAMCVHEHVRCPGKWQTARRLDTPPERHPARLPSGSSPLHPGSRYIGSVQGEAVHAGDAVWLPNCQMARWGTPFAVRG